MSWSVVQTAVKYGTAITSGPTHGAPATVTFGNPVSAGSVVIGFCGYFPGGDGPILSFTMTDDQGNSYISPDGFSQQTNGYTQDVWYLTNVTNGPSTISFNTNVTGQDGTAFGICFAVAVEVAWTGGGPAVFDTHSFIAATITSTTVSGAPFTPASANDFFFAALCESNFGANEAPGAGWTLLTRDTNDFSMTEYQIASSNATVVPTFTANAATGNYVIYALAFSPPPPPPGFTQRTQVWDSGSRSKPTRRSRTIQQSPLIAISAPAPQNPPLLPTYAQVEVQYTWVFPDPQPTLNQQKTPPTGPVIVPYVPKNYIPYIEVDFNWL